jgi:hypothetical protein
MIFATQLHKGITCACNCIPKTAILQFPRRKFAHRAQKNNATMTNLLLPSAKVTPSNEQEDTPPTKDTRLSTKTPTPTHLLPPIVWEGFAYTCRHQFITDKQIDDFVSSTARNYCRSPFPSKEAAARGNTMLETSMACIPSKGSMGGWSKTEVTPNLIFIL